MWFVTPTYLCRKWLAFRLLEGLPINGRFLEIGAGAGEFLYELGKRGFKGRGVDVSEEAVEYANARIGIFSQTINVSRQDFLQINDDFNIIFAFEVLEHLEDDEMALGKMRELLDKDGYLMISVPARMKHWGPNDEWSGHLRRYEREELRSKAESQGLETIAIHSFGVPIANITKPFYDFLIQRQLQGEGKLNNSRKSRRSWRVPVARLFHPLFSLMFNRFTLYPLLLMQCLFLKTDMGTGYLAVFKKG